MVDERFDGRTIFSGAHGPLVLDLDGVGRITSFGVRAWLEALGRVRADLYYCFVRCRPQVLIQFNMVAGFAGRGELLSFYVPYLCGECGRESEVLVDLLKDALTSEPPPIACSACGGKAEIDDDPATYFEYAMRAPRPNPPAAVEALLGGRALGAGHGLKISREIGDPLTALSLSGELDGRANFRRVAEGLDGPVLVLCGGVTAATLEGVARLCELVRAPGASFAIARVPPFLLRELPGDLPAELVSVRLPYRCGNCGGEPVELELEAKQVHELRAGGEGPLRCRSCGSPLTCGLSEAEVQEVRARRWAEVNDPIRARLSRQGTGAGNPYLPCPSCRLAHAPEAVCPGSLRTVAPPLLQAAGADPLVGSLLGSFRIVKKLGGGGMGTVYLGEHSIIGSKVAVKVLHEHLSADPTLVQRFFDEARTVNLIGHENIVNIFDMNVAPPRSYYLVMEHLEGSPLAQLLDGPVEAAVAVPVLLQVCDALQAAHARGVVHRDLKPENIFLVNRGQLANFVKVLDFGVAKLFDRRGRENTPTGAIVGSPDYMAPEQAEGAMVDGRADIYSLGVIAYQLATGRAPFKRGSVVATLLAQMEDAPPPAHEVNPKVPRSWSDAIARAMAKAPSDRYQDAASFGAALEAQRPSLPPPAIVPPSPAASVASAPSAPRAAAKATPLRAAAQVFSPGGKSLARLECAEASQKELFLKSDGLTFLPLFARVKVALELEWGERIECACKVTRQVTPPEASAAKTIPGYGLEVLDAPAELRRLLDRPRAEPGGEPPASKRPAPEGLAAALARFQKRMLGDDYLLLGLTLDASFTDVRRVGRKVRVELERLIEGEPPPSDKAKLEAALQRVRKAVDTLGDPILRLEHDARHGNFRGVACCLGAGVSMAEIEGVRRRIEPSGSAAAAEARRLFEAGAEAEKNGELKAALDQYEAALRLEPLNLRVHQRYWEARRRSPGGS
ncbi:MAG: protein kinase [Myxococcales bacterium]|nr:protein kinase [Myxococcales bacterium]